MPSVIATDISIEAWMRKKPCPISGSKQRLVHRWIYSAALASQVRGLTTDRAFDVIAGATIGCGRTVSAKEINEQIAAAYSTIVTASRAPLSPEAVPPYDIDLLVQRASRISVEITEDWLAEVSPECVLDLSPASFLQQLYEPGEHVFITDNQKSKDGWIWNHGDPADSLDHYVRGHERGVWFLNQAVTGTEINGSFRSEPNVTAWRYGVLESDIAPTDLWLRILVQLHLPIAAIYTSGGKSVHALFRVDAQSKSEWDDIVRHGPGSVLSQLVPYGADPNALTAVRLTRLPGCARGETGQLQKLLYLNPDPGRQPIYEKL